MKHKLTEIWYMFVYKLFKNLGNPEFYYAIVTKDCRFNFGEGSIINTVIEGASIGLYLGGRIVSDTAYALLYL